MNTALASTSNMPVRLSSIMPTLSDDTLNLFNMANIFVPGTVASCCAMWVWCSPSATGEVRDWYESSAGGQSSKSLPVFELQHAKPFESL